MDEPVLSVRRRNRALLHRQLLLGRARLPVPEALRRIAGVQSQYPPSSYLALAARLDGFRRSTLDRALARRTAVHATTLRGTIHLHPAGDYWPLELLVRERRRHQWLLMRKDVPDAELAAAEAAVAARLAEGPAWRKELSGLVGAEPERGALASGSLLRLPPSSTWERRRADLLARAEDELGPPTPAQREAGPDLLVTRCLAAFGPSSRREVAHWCGLPMGDVADPLERRGTRRFRSIEGEVLHDLPRLPLPPEDAPAPVRLLPQYDQPTLGPFVGRGVCDGETRERAFPPESTWPLPTVLIDGAVAGTWRFDGARVVLHPFTRLPRPAAEAAESEARRLEAFAADA